MKAICTYSEELVWVREASAPLLLEVAPLHTIRIGPSFSHVVNSCSNVVGYVILLRGVAIKGALRLHNTQL